MTPSGWSDQKLYERTGALSHQAVMDSVNAGVGLGHWMGHGNETGIYMNGGTVPFFVSDDAELRELARKTLGGVQRVHEAAVVLLVGQQPTVRQSAHRRERQVHGGRSVREQDE